MTYFDDPEPPGGSDWAGEDHWEDEPWDGGGPSGWQPGDGPTGPPLGRGPAQPRQPRYAGGGRGGGGRRGDAGRGGLGRGPRIALGVAVTALLVVGALGVWVQRQVDPSGSPGAVQTITVPSGASSASIGHLLSSKGVIGSSHVWDWYLKVKGGGPFEAGEYDLPLHSSMGDVIDVMSRGPKPPEQRRFTVPEGFTVKQTIARLADPSKGLGFSATDLQQLLTSGQVRSTYQPAGTTSSEGILFPDTYEVAKDATPLSVLQEMVGQLDSTLSGLDVQSAATTLHLTPYEILITASLIEEESKVPEERPMVARVIYNRLKAGIPLGIDATSRYEAEIEGRDRSKVNFSSTSPFNTRKSKGLPPTPIASPGAASLEAALHPADGTWIYYVLKDSSGHHEFTDSAAEFSKAKQRCHDAGLGCG